MKKILSLVLALTLVLSTMSMAFADTAFPDIDADDDQLAEAAGLLNSLGVLAGDENGNYNPEDPLTREAMAKVVVHLLGYTEDDYKGYGNEFTDAQNMWSSDVIGLAADEGIVNGYGDGIFAPKDDVTYLQAAIMLIRALGYTDASLNNGVDAFDAGKYRSKALELGLFDGVATAWNEPATRGDLAIMSYNNLENDMVAINADGDVSVLKDKNDNPVSLLSKTATVADEDNKVVITPDHVEYAATDISMYMYQMVDGYYVMVEDADGDDIESFVYINESLSDTVTDAVETTTLTGTAGVVTIDVDGDGNVDSDDTYNVTDETKVFYNGAETAYDNVYATLEKDSVSVTIVTTETNNVVTVEGIIATNRTAIKQVSDEYETDDVRFEGIDLPTDDGDVDLTNVMVTGDANDMYEIEENDIIEAYSAYDDEVVKIVVTRDAVEGTITRKNSDGDVVIDTVGEYEEQDLIDKTVLDVDDEGVFYYDSEGTIVAYDADGEVAVADYMVITDMTPPVLAGTSPNQQIYFEAKITLLDGEGNKEVYEIATDADASFDGTDADAYSGLALDNRFAIGAVVSNFSLDSDDMIDDITVEGGLILSTYGDTDSKTFDAYVADDAVVFEVEDEVDMVTFDEDTTFEAVSLDSLTAKGLEDSEYTILEDEGKIVVVFAFEALTTESEDYAYIFDVEEISGDIQEVKLYVNGVEEIYNTDANGVVTLSAEDMFKLEMDGDVITKATTVTAITVTGMDDDTTITVASNGVFEIADATITGSSEVRFVPADDATVYEVDADGNVRVRDINFLEKDNNDSADYSEIKIYENTDGDVVAIIAVLK